MSNKKRKQQDSQPMPSATAVAGEALRTGFIPVPTRPVEHDAPVNDAHIQAGDPDVDVLSATYVGDEAPGGHMPTPDQDSVDEIGRAVGIAEADSGALRTSSEILDHRDQHRAEQDVPDRNPFVEE